MNSAELIARMCAREEFTVIPAARLKALYQIAQSIAGMPGAFVECGVWNGGSAAVLAHAAYMRRRHVWLFDSWEGTPEPGNEDGQQARAKYDSHGGKLCVGDITKPGQAFAVTGITDNILHLRKGWFEETLPRDAPEIGDIAILHIDSDWYASVKVCLQVLYPQVAEGGLVIIDDYGHWVGCRTAVDECLAGVQLNKIDYTSRYFFKDRQGAQWAH